MNDKMKEKESTKLKATYKQKKISNALCSIF